MEKASCAECEGIFDLIPPADYRYNTPMLSKPDTPCMERKYRCNNLPRHENIVYWITKPKS